MNIGKRLKDIREKTKVEGRFVSQKKLAELSGVNVTSIAFIEINQIKNPGVKTIEKLMKPLNKTLKDFFNVK